MNPPGARLCFCFSTSAAVAPFLYPLCQGSSKTRAPCRNAAHTVAYGPSKKTELHATKKWPRASGPLVESLIRGTHRPKPNTSGTSDCVLGLYRPRRGRSPLRMVIHAFTIKTRSIAARRRPNNVTEGDRSVEAVLGIRAGIGVLWFLLGQVSAAIFERQYRYTRCQTQPVCLHSSNLPPAVQ